jgi:hypothetical protein
LQHALVGQGRHTPERVHGQSVHADDADRIECASAVEHRKPREQPTLIARQQAVAPRDGVPEASMTLWKISLGPAKRVDPFVQPVMNRLHRQQPRLGRGELDCQRQPIDKAADRGDLCQVILARQERRVHRAGPVHEEGDRVRDLLGISCGTALQAEWRDGVGRLSGECETLSAGDQHAHA